LVGVQLDGGEGGAIHQGIVALATEALGVLFLLDQVGDVGGDLLPLLVAEFGDLFVDLGVDFLDCLLETLVLFGMLVNVLLYHG
jgi:hypothetical protein